MQTRCSLILFMFSLLAFSLSKGCTFFQLEKQLSQLELVQVVSGTIHNQTHPDKSVLIVLLEKGVDGHVAAQASVLKPGLTKFALEIPAGNYYLFAFEDLNNNLAFEENEPSGIYGRPDEIVITDQSPATLTGLDIALNVSGSEGFKGMLRQISVSPEMLSGSFIKIGHVIGLDDPLLSSDYGVKGYWEPLTFVREIGFCIYFNEPYDPKKIPVLFIHGALGTPSGWKKIVQRLDSKRFQAWFYYYPSGLPLDKNSRALNQMVMALHRHYKFKQMHVVASSMGGLVARSLILLNHYESLQNFIHLFISISTPWNGHRLTEKGVRGAPVAIPSWYDMVPDSPFIQTLFKNKLPDSVEHHLLFSYKGDCSLFLGNNDGTVEISSQLDPRAQSEASRVFGYDEDHGSILDSEVVLEQIERLISDRK